ncbi:MAG TPA: hypothetical protein VIG44_09950 [Thermomicrobiales bacterium]
MSGTDYDALLRRRRIWGVPPDVVAHLAAECQREQAELQTRVKELEGRLARVSTERDEANQTTDTLRERVARLEQENQEIANRPETIREEAMRFVVDAWAEAQTLREQTRREIEEAETKAREEIAAIRRDMIEERQRHEAEMADERQRYETEMTEERQRSEAEIAALRERRQRAIADLESLAASLLGQAARGIAPRPTPGASSDAATPDAPHYAPLPISSGGAAEDQLLAKALDDLEAILNASRKPNGG